MGRAGGNHREEFIEVKNADNAVSGPNGQQRPNGIETEDRRRVGDTGARSPFSQARDGTRVRVREGGGESGGEGAEAVCEESADSETGT